MCKAESRQKDREAHTVFVMWWLDGFTGAVMKGRAEDNKVEGNQTRSRSSELQAIGDTGIFWMGEWHIKEVI